MVEEATVLRASAAEARVVVAQREEEVSSLRRLLASMRVGRRQREAEARSLRRALAAVASRIGAGAVLKAAEEISGVRRLSEDEAVEAAAGAGAGDPTAATTPLRAATGALTPPRTQPVAGRRHRREPGRARHSQGDDETAAAAAAAVSAAGVAPVVAAGTRSHAPGSASRAEAVSRSRLLREREHAGLGLAPVAEVEAGDESWLDHTEAAERGGADEVSWHTPDPQAVVRDALRMEGVRDAELHAPDLGQKRLAFDEADFAARRTAVQPVAAQEAAEARPAGSAEPAGASMEASEAGSGRRSGSSSRAGSGSSSPQSQASAADGRKAGGNEQWRLAAAVHSARARHLQAGLSEAVETADALAGQRNSKQRIQYVTNLRERAQQLERQNGRIWAILTPDQRKQLTAAQAGDTKKASKPTSKKTASRK